MSAQRALVVDDDPDIVHFVRVNLELEGFELETASDGRSGVDSVLEHRPDLVLLDVMMPGMDGISALRELSITSRVSKHLGHSAHRQVIVGGPGSRSRTWRG